MDCYVRNFILKNKSLSLMCSRILLFIFSLQVKVILKGKFPSYNYAHPK